MSRSRVLVLSLCLLTLCASPAGAAAQAVFSRRAWLEDYAYLKQQLELHYSNLAWFGSPESGIDVPALDRRTTRLLRSAQSDAEARLAVRDFVTRFDDGHFSELPFLESGTGKPAEEPPPAVLDRMTPIAGCAALGYADKSPDAFSLPFESLPGFTLESDGMTGPFRAGTVEIGGARIGIVRIRNFSESQFPSLCTSVWTEAPPGPDAEGFHHRVTMRWLSTLADRLRLFRQSGVTAVLIDVGSNSGGNDSGDWFPRLFAARPIVSARLFLSAGARAGQYFDEEADELKAAAAKAGTPAETKAVAEAAEILAARRRANAAVACDMRWVWTERRRWNPAGCNRLADAGWASGPFWAEKPAGVGPDVAERLFWPSIADRFRGAWTGAAFVLINGATYSSAEMFAARMRDSGIARLIGTRTGGDGCGFMVGTPPTVLPHSQMRFRVSNCVRLRADGTDEVAGISPDLPVAAIVGESPRARAMRVLAGVRDSVGPAR